MHGESDTGKDRRAAVDEESADPSAEGSSRSPSASENPPADPLAQAQAEAARLKDAWMRTAADFDNFRKRTRKEVDDARRSGREDLLRALLPVFDNLGRAIQSAQRSTDIKAMVEGLSMVDRQFLEALAREGISRIPTVGRPFDPGLHEAIQQVETDDHAAGTIIAEVQPGYVQGDRLMRAAMVVVARAKDTTGETDESAADAPN